MSRDLDGGSGALAREDGTFALVGLAPGAHRLRARLGADVSDTVTVQVEAEGEPPPVELTVDAGLSADVKVVVHPDRGEAGGSLVAIEDSTGRMKLLVADQQGVVRARFSPPFPERVRAAAYAHGVWGLASWAPWAAAQEGVTVAVQDGGALAVSSKTTSGVLSVESASGWNLTRLLGMVGLFPLLQPGSEVVVEGLPGGHYTVSCQGVARTVVVRAGAREGVDLP